MPPEALLAINRRLFNKNKYFNTTGKQKLKLKLKAIFTSACDESEHISNMNMPNIIM